MTHTLHEQEINITSQENFLAFLRDQLGFKDSSQFTNHVCLKDENPCTDGYKIFDATKTHSLAGILSTSYSQKFYYQNNFDLSVRYLCSASSATRPMIWAQDVNDDWTIITEVGSFCGSNSNKLTSGINVAVKNIDNKCCYTLTKIARPDNGVPFKGLYMVNSAQFFTPHETLININGDIYRLISIQASTSEAQYPTLAFKVSDE